MRRAVLLVAILGVLLVTAGWYLLVISPTNERIADAEDQLDAAQGEHLQLETQLKRLQRIQENQLLYVEALGALEAQIPPTPQTAALVDGLDVLAGATGVVFEGVTMGFPDAIEGADYFRIPMSILIEGQYFEILGYVYGLEDMPRIVVTQNVALSPATDDDGFTILRVVINAETYTSADLDIPIPEGFQSPDEETTGDGSSDGTSEDGGDE